MKTQLIRAAMTATYYPYLRLAFKEDKNYFELDGHEISTLIALISVFRYKPTQRQMREGISICRSLYYYLLDGYQKLPF